MKKRGKSVIHKIKPIIYKYHKIRKRKEENLPRWKENWNRFNEKRLGCLERFVDKFIPWLVLLLLIIILGDLSSYLNIYHWEQIASISKFFENNKLYIGIIDQIIVAFFVIDLYFNFFKKRTFWSFLRTSIFDIIAIAPLGTIFRLMGIEQASPVITRGLESAEIVEREGGISKFLKVEELVKVERLQKIEKIPRLFRLNRLIDFSKKKRKKK